MLRGAKLKYYLKNKSACIERAVRWNKVHKHKHQKTYYKTHYQEILHRNERRKEADPVTHANYQKRYNDKIKNRLLTVLGDKCACCNEKTVEFLTLDHVYGGGRQHRLHCKGSLYIDVLKDRNKFKKYRILCMNCNFATRYGKICPHKY